MDKIEIICPHCGQALQAFVGPTSKVVQCPMCRAQIELPFSDRNEFWADKVKRFKQEGLSNEVIRESRKNIPYPAAFSEIAIAIRKDIRARRKQKTDTKNILRKLYKWAVIKDFFTEIEWNKIVTERILHSTARSCIKGIKAPYDTIGYKNLSLLNKTDVKWLVEAFGEPRSHSSARDANLELWQQAVETFRSTEEKDEQHLWQSFGFDGPPTETGRASSPPTSSASEHTGNFMRNRVCVLALIVTVSILIILFLFGGY